MPSDREERLVGFFAIALTLIGAEVHRRPLRIGSRAFGDDGIDRRPLELSVGALVILHCVPAALHRFVHVRAGRR